MSAETLSLVISSAIKSALGQVDLKSVLTDAISDILSDEEVWNEITSIMQDDLDKSFCNINFINDDGKMTVYIASGEGDAGRVFVPSIDIEDYGELLHLSPSQAEHIQNQIDGIESTIRELAHLKQKLTKSLTRKRSRQ